MNNLITVPTFNFSQGDVFEGKELPVTVCYYDNGGEKVLIELTQEDNHLNFTSIAELKALVKLIEKHLPEATAKLKK